MGVHNKLALLISILISAFAWTAKADRIVLSQQDIQYWGFSQKIAPRILQSSTATYWSYKQHELSFPIELRQGELQLGGNMHQFQNWTEPAYYHAGLDIRTDADAAVRTPVSGKIEAGYYAFTDSYDGHSEKQFLPLEEILTNNKTPPWGEFYFEVAIIDRFGNRFEFHHINPNTLPLLIKNKILNHGTVSINDIVGFVAELKENVFGYNYTHMHYNIVNTTGLYMNPMYVSTAIEDTSLPTIVNVYATSKSLCGSQSPYLHAFEDNTPLETENFIVIEAYDHISNNMIPNPPTVIKAHFNNHESFEWNFTKSLFTSEGLLPNLNDVYLKQYCDVYGESKLSPILKTATGNYKFFIKIPIPFNYNGEAQIDVMDHFGNTTKRTILIKNDPI